MSSPKVNCRVCVAERQSSRISVRLSSAATSPRATWMQAPSSRWSVVEPSEARPAEPFDQPLQLRRAPFGEVKVAELDRGHLGVVVDVDQRPRVPDIFAVGSPACEQVTSLLWVSLPEPRLAETHQADGPRVLDEAGEVLGGVLAGVQPQRVIEVPLRRREIATPELADPHVVVTLHERHHLTAGRLEEFAGERCRPPEVAAGEIDPTEAAQCGGIDRLGQAAAQRGPPVPRCS